MFQTNKSTSTRCLWLSVWLQVSQYTFAMCSYREKKAEPVELLQLDGYTVDYTDPQPGEPITQHESQCDDTELTGREAKALELCKT